MLSTQQPTEHLTVHHQFEHSNELVGGGANVGSGQSSPQLSPESSSPPATQSRGGKAVTPATVIAWLREHYKLGKHGYSKKAAVFAHYQALCVERGAEAAISSTFFGKLVKRAFPEIKTIRKGPRGKVEQCYDRLKPIDPAKASRARWLERMNLYLSALQSSTAQGSAPTEQPPRHTVQQQLQHSAEEVVDGAYASGLDGGHFLASLLPSFGSPSSSGSSSTSSPAPSSPSTAEFAALSPAAHQHHHQHHHHQQQQPVEPPYLQEARHHHHHHPYYRDNEPSLLLAQTAALAYSRQDGAVWQQGGVLPVGTSRSAYLSTALSAPAGHHSNHHRHPYHRHHHPHASAGDPFPTHEPSPFYDQHHQHLHVGDQHYYPLY